MRPAASSRIGEWMVLVAFALGLSLAACAPMPPSPPSLPSPTVSEAPLAQPMSWKALLIAGDDAEPAFDNGVDAMAGKLEAFGVPPANITILMLFKQE